MNKENVYIAICFYAYKNTKYDKIDSSEMNAKGIKKYDGMWRSGSYCLTTK